MRYTKVNKDDVYGVLVSTSLDFWNPIQGAINLKNIASLLETSRYQVKKWIEVLKAEGIVELKCIHIYSEDEVFPPYWGYVLTNKGKTTAYYQKKHDEGIKLLQECFS